MAQRSGILAAAFVLAATGATAATDPLARCCAGKLRATAARERQLVRCHVTAAARGTAVDPACVAAAGTALEAAFARVEQGGGCTGVGDGPLVRADLERLVASLATGLRPAPAASPCAARKLKQAGSLAAAALQASAKLAPHPADRLGELDPVVTTLRQRMVDAFARLDAAGGCLATGDADTVAIAVLVGAGAPTAPDGVLLATLRTCGRCGDGVRGGSEACDGFLDATACPGACETTCTCPAIPVCGNGVKEAGEQCDGTDLAGCLACQADCTCAPPVCGDGVAEPTEQCDGTQLGGVPAPACANLPGLAQPGCLPDCQCCALLACSAFNFDAPCCPGYDCPQRVGPNSVSYCQKTCQATTDCNAGSVCFFGHCRTPNCASDVQCGAGGYCVTGVCCLNLPGVGVVCP